MAVTSTPFRLAAGEPLAQPLDIVCFSHLRWDFVFQRPNHLMSQAARDRRVFYIEEPVWSDEPARIWISRRRGRLHIVRPHMRIGLEEEFRLLALRQLIDGLFEEYGIRDHVAWYYTPMALRYTHHLTPAAIVYDVMDELSAFLGAPPILGEMERELFHRADVVFTGGQSLYEAKRDRHPNVHRFASSVDRAHFARARGRLDEPEDQVGIPRPRLGYFGVIDERMDLDLVARAAALRPDWQWVFVGPVVKVDEGHLPRRANIHWLGPRDYAALPGYIAGWDVALMPFAHNAATRFISPTKGPEYVAAGRPVVSTSIRDVVEPYGRLGLVHIADTAEAFVTAAEAAMAEDPAARRAAADRFLEAASWERTWSEMADLVAAAIEARAPGIPVRAGTFQ